MRTTSLAILCAFVVGTRGFAQASVAERVDGSAPGTILLVIKSQPVGKRAQIVREPKYLNVPQRNILLFSPEGTAADLAMALATFDRIRAKDGEAIKTHLTTDNIGIAKAASSNSAKDAVNQPYKDAYLGEMQALIDLVRSRPERVVRGLGKVRYIQIDRPVVASQP